MPDYEIKEHNEGNYDVRKILFTSQAYDKKKWAFITDYARFNILYNEGGIYLDADVELIKSLDPIVEKGNPFGGFDKVGYFNSALGIGGQKGTRIFGLIAHEYDAATFVRPNGKIRWIYNYMREANVLNKLGYKAGNVGFQTIGGMDIYPAEYFSPYDYVENKIVLTDNTYSIHHILSSWMTEDIKRKIVEIHPKLKDKYNV